MIRSQKEATRKKRITQISVTAFIVVLLIFLGFSWLQTIRANSAKTEAESAKIEAEEAKGKVIQSLEKAEAATKQAEDAKKAAIENLNVADKAKKEAEEAKRASINNLKAAEKAKKAADRAKKTAIYNLNEAIFNDINKLILDLKTYKKIYYNEAITEKIEAINKKISNLNPTSINSDKTKELIDTLKRNPSFKVAIKTLESKFKNQSRN